MYLKKNNSPILFVSSSSPNYVKNDFRTIANREDIFRWPGFRETLYTVNTSKHSKYPKTFQHKCLHDLLIIRPNNTCSVNRH